MIPCSPPPIGQACSGYFDHTVIHRQMIGSVTVFILNIYWSNVKHAVKYIYLRQGKSVEEQEIPSVEEKLEEDGVEKRSGSSLQVSFRLNKLFLAGLELILLFSDLGPCFFKIFSKILLLFLFISSPAHS